MPLTPEAFVASLDEENRQTLARLEARQSEGAPPEAITVAALLQLALKNELEAAELAARWLPDTPELDAKLALARQCGDEAKHYRWIEARLVELGVDVRGVDPSKQPRSPLAEALGRLTTTVERAAAGPFTREALAVMRNEVFARFCDERGDAATAALYRERIQPDEQHHHELGRRLLLAYARTDDEQERARAACRLTLRLADEAQEMARMKAGLCRLPGC